MDALTKLNILGLLLAAVFLGMACVRSQRVRAWRAAVNPSAEEVPDSAFTVARVTFVALAGICVYMAVQGFGVSDDASWDDSELTSAVNGATDALDGSFTYGDPNEDATTEFDGDEYATTIEEEIVEHGGGDAPQYGADAALTGPPLSGQASYRITANGANNSYCVRVTRTHSGDVETVAPGLPGDQAAVTMPKYTYAVSSQAGEC
ncbi:hypothetical protein [Streptomyces sp. NBC_00076]|uniref:hypothetical protein n=1 Tax=Streptomyces sp. NBC_00076 TaxID=2975642 RepID=UPI0032495775